MKTYSSFVLAAAVVGAVSSAPALSADDNPYRNPSAAEIRARGGASVTPADARSGSSMGNSSTTVQGNTGSSTGISTQGSAVIAAPIGTVTTSNGVTATVVPGDYRPSTTGAIDIQNRSTIDGRR